MKILPLLTAGLLLVSAPGAMADPAPASEYEIKAAFLYNFAKFVEWPADSFQKENAPFVIGLLGEDPFGQAIDDLLSGKTVQGRPISLKRLASAEEAKACHLVFISSTEQENIGDILQALAGRPVLTVSDARGFVRQGGMIGFVLENRKVRFDINNMAAQKENLKLSSQLLKVAKTVKEAP